MHPTVSSAGEHELIERIRAKAGSPPDFVSIGIGDDAAVLRPERGTSDVITTDSLVEGVHFRRDWTPARAIGHKALAVNLSDLAAMGATPRAALLSLILPVDFSLADFDALTDGFLALARSTRTAIVGGNLARSPGPLVVDVTAVGSIRPRRVLRRGGATPGDGLYVSGNVGVAAAGLGMLASGRPRSSFTPEELRCVAAYETPEPRLRLAGIVARTGAARASIDLSDGLADAAARLARAADIGVVVDAAAISVDPAVRAWFDSQGTDPVRAALGGGEDYELAFAVAPRQERRFLAAARRCPELSVQRVGTFEAVPGTRLLSQGSVEPLSAAGYTHF